MIKEYFHIAHLISRHLSGEVTPEESRFLDKWRKESKSHEQLFQKICSDEHYAQHEIRKWSLIRRLDGKVSKHVSRGWSSEGDI